MTSKPPLSSPRGRSPWGILLLACLCLTALALWAKGRSWDPSLFAGLEPSEGGASRSPGEKAGWDPAPLAALVPRRIPGTGWPRTGEIEVFPHDRIADKIDGAVAEYDLFGVKGLVCASYQDPERKRRGVDLYIYEMGSRPDALGILASQCPPGVEILPLGEGGWRDKTSVYFRVGSLCVQALGTEPGKAVEEAALALARAVAEKAPVPPGADRELAPLRLLPRQGRLAGTEGYSRGDPFGEGYPFLKNVFKADYGDTPVTLLVMKEEKEGGAAAALEAWRKVLEEEGSLRRVDGIPGAVLGERAGAWEGGVVRKGRLLGVVGADSFQDAAAWLEKLEKRAREVLGE